MKKIIIAFALVLVAAVILSSCTISIKGLEYEVYAKADKYEAGTFEYDPKEIKKVVIDWTKGRVEVNEEDGETLKVAEDSESLEEDKRVHHFIDNGVLRIKFCASGYDGTFTPDEIDKNKTVYVNIPAGIDVEINTVSATVWLYMGYPYYNSYIPRANPAEPLSVKIATTSGNIETGSFICARTSISSVSGGIKASFSSDDTKIETVSGTVNVVCTSKTLTAKSISGDLTFIASATESAKFESVSGDISAKGKYAAMNVKSVSGTVEVGPSFENATVSTTSGNITLKEFSGTLEFKTTSGKMSTGIPHTSDGDTYVFGDGSRTAKVSTVSGNLTVTK